MEAQETPETPAEQEKKYDSFVPVDSLELTDTLKNKLCLFIKKNDYGQYKIEYTLNDMPIEPAKFNGKNSAFAFWNLLISKINRKKK